ncbi:hypothetical protein [Ornithinibacillus scapharcae]|uniref:hypothetical protein n=1 Tax=Ornithinibacillus scapharcae TaxID=1147159 RepID=UPI000225B3F7|nr:hypothetical protein [Ornithinibacillus scapharcae]
MKKFILSVCFLLTIILVACSSPESEELAEYHNSYIENINTKAMLVDEELQKSLRAETPAMALELQQKNVIPLVDEIKEFIHSRDPETEVVKEIHNMRIKQLDTWAEAVRLRYQALEKTVEQATKEEVQKLLSESDEKLLDAQKKGEKADERFLELADKYNIE